MENKKSWHTSSIYRAGWRSNEKYTPEASVSYKHMHKIDNLDNIISKVKTLLSFMVESLIEDDEADIIFEVLALSEKEAFDVFLVEKNLKIKDYDLFWQGVEIDVFEAIKTFLLKNHSQLILNKFQNKINAVIGFYLRKLPGHILSSEGDDLANIARIEFLEAIRAWDYKKRENPWGLALVRIIGSMKDHLRYLTKADPTRLYNWITSAAEFYMTVNSATDIENKIEYGIQLSNAMKYLTEQEKKVLIMHSKDDYTFKEIGIKIDLSESQVSRIYNKTVGKLKQILAKPN